MSFATHSGTGNPDRAVSPLPASPYMTMKEVCAFARFSRTHIYRMEAEGTFPKRIKFGPARIVFSRAEVEAWARNRESERAS